MTEKLRRPVSARSYRSTTPRRRALATLAAVGTVGALLPAVTTVAARAATPVCAAPTGLVSDDALRGPAAQVKDVRLAWSPVAGASTYQLQVSPDQDFTNNIFVDTTTVSTRYDVPPTVLKPSSYYWRVRTAGAQCWSDDGSAAAPQFAVAWKEAPVPATPTGIVNPQDLHFSWSAIPEASAYEIQVNDATTGAIVGRCYTAHTSVSPYDEVSGQVERLPSNGTCFGPNTLGYRRPYVWEVRGIDTTGVDLNGKPYAYVSGGVNPSEPKSGQHSPVTVDHVYLVSGGGVIDTTDATTVLAGTRIAIVGSGFSADTSKDSVTIGGVGVDSNSLTYDNATHDLFAYVPAKVPGGVVDVTVGTPLGTSNISAGDEILELGHVNLGESETFAKAVVGPWSPSVVFTQTEGTSGGDGSGAPSSLVSYQPGASGQLGGTACGPVGPACTDTPTLHWTGSPTATTYRVYLWDDQDQTSLDREYETSSTWLTPRDALLDDQAGQAYYWQVQSCSIDFCSAVSPVASFRKDSRPVSGESPRSGATVTNDNVVLSWQHWQVTNGSGLAAEQYHVQISTSCTFDGTMLDDALVDAPEFVNPSTVYPNGLYYWRVQAVDASGSPLAWDAPNQYTNDCSDVPSFTLNKQFAGAAPPSGAASGGTPSTNAPAIVVDATDRSVPKGGHWVARKANGASRGSALVTDGRRKQSLSYTFRRSTVTVSYCVGPMDGYFSVYVDGRIRRTINGYKPFTTCGKTFLVGGLSLGGTHKVVVQASNRKGAPHGSTQLVVDFLRLS